MESSMITLADMNDDKSESIIKDSNLLSTSIPKEISLHEQDVIEYMTAEGLMDCKKRKKKLVNLSPHSFAVFKLNAIISKYCKTMELDKAYESYQIASHLNIYPSPNTYTNLLSLTAGFGDQGSGNTSTREIEPPSNYDAAFSIFNDMKKFSIRFTEASYTAMIRCFCLHEKPEQALQLYEEMKRDLNSQQLLQSSCSSQNLSQQSSTNQQPPQHPCSLSAASASSAVVIEQLSGESTTSTAISTSLSSASFIPKLRTFYPLLKLFSQFNNTDTCFYLYHEIRHVFKIIPTEREYQCLLTVTYTSHDGRFYQILEDMIEDVYTPCYSTWNIVKLWFQRENDHNNDNSNSSSSNRNSNSNNGFNSCHNGNSIETNDRKGGNGNKSNTDTDMNKKIWTITTSTVNPLGVVMVNPIQLKSMDLSETIRQSMLIQIEQLATFTDATVSERSIYDSSTANNTSSVSNSNHNNKNSSSDNHNSTDEDALLIGSSSCISNNNNIDTLAANTITGATTSAVATSNTTIVTIATTTDKKVLINPNNKKHRKQHKTIPASIRQQLFTQFKSWLARLPLESAAAPVVVLESTAVSEPSVAAVGQHSEAVQQSSSSSSSSSCSNNNSENHTVMKDEKYTSLLSSSSSSSSLLPTNKRYTIVIDGANIGYFKQNYGNTPQHVDYHQIDWVLHYLVSMGHTPLLFLHCRHINYQYLHIPTDCIEIIEKWKKSNCLYITPAGCNDDWYWLYCAFFLKCKTVTNDEMRDHHFQMLSPRWFAQWKERNQIHFSFGDWCSMKNSNGSSTNSSSSHTMKHNHHHHLSKIKVGEDEEEEKEEDDIISTDESDNDDDNNDDHDNDNWYEHKRKRNHTNNNSTFSRNNSNSSIRADAHVVKQAKVDVTSLSLDHIGEVMMWRQPRLDIPRPYSHRFQCIVTTNSSDRSSNSYNEIVINRSYFFPPPVATTAVTMAVTAPTTKVSNAMSNDENSNEWLCIY